MKLALFNSALGVVLAFWLGTQVLGLSGPEIAGAILASIFAGFVALTATTRLESSPRTKRWIATMPRTWIFHSALYFGIMLLCSSILRDPRNFLVLILPLLLVVGVSIVAWGPLQDRLVARSQRKARESAHSMR